MPKWWRHNICGQIMNGRLLSTISSKTCASVSVGNGVLCHKGLQSCIDEERRSDPTHVTALDCTLSAVSVSGS